ncbi:MAG TPA: hypothetical protein VI434_15650 [Candidatus Dormibacteraeota bacterium]
MPRSSPLDSARRRRDQGLARARKITVYAGVSASGLTALIALVAATTAPGRSVATAPAATQTNAPGDPTTGVTSPGFVPPGEVPTGGNGGIPSAVSGGS